MRGIPPDESVRQCGWPICTPHLSQTRVQHTSFQQRQERSMLHVCKEAHACCRITHNVLQTACSLFTEPAMTSRILSYGRESALRPSPSSFCSLSNPARTTLMTSAVKTQRVNASPPPPPRPVLRRIPGGRHWRGGDRRSQVWGVGGSRCSV